VRGEEGVVGFSGEIVEAEGESGEGARKNNMEKTTKPKRTRMTADRVTLSI